ncbi:porin [Rhizobium sp. P32RR-XVIII]|uniref:porin n=1 Tax=Rhizobium sp. P32RR-XVIII TaxID=2726738 RepID=UPI00145780DA|nr:porin [Rhizobium sp. P32RR-XVIII]NLS02981.1 porin [Rhizobium sp. P32RR-XVIII]
MNIKSLLLGSAAALAVVSGAQAADAIVAAEPEPVEYVRVCDAYGTGYFYIPGTETCLKIQGYIRFQVDWSAGDLADNLGGEDWSARTRGQVAFTAKSDTEYGPLTGVIVYQANFRPNGPANSQDIENETIIDEAYMDIAGFRVGKFVNWWDNDFSGETEVINNNTNFNAIRYQYDSGDFYAGIAVEELTTEGFETRIVDGVPVLAPIDGGNNIGIDGAIGGKFGAISAELLVGYDVDREAVAVRTVFYADIGPGTLGLAGVYADKPSDYYDNGEWAIAAQYAVKATDKFTITPAVQYTDNIDTDTDGDFDSGSQWRAGVTLDYEIVENLSTKVTVNYISNDHDNGVEDDDGVTGFFRLQRSF